MEDTLITYPTAKLAKEKGFNQFDIRHMFVYSECDPESYFYHNPVQSSHDDSYNRGYLYRAPTQSFLAKWLREVHLIHISVIISDTDDYINEPRYKVEVRMRRGDMVKMFKTTYMFLKYDDALETGLQEALKLIKL